MMRLLVCAGGLAACRSVAAALMFTGAGFHAPARRSAPPCFSMVRFRKPPQEILEKIRPGWRGDDVGTAEAISNMWFAFESVYGSQEEALAASRKKFAGAAAITRTPPYIIFGRRSSRRRAATCGSPTYAQVLLPIINSPATIIGAHAVLVELFGKEEARSIIRSHPGILACGPSSLATTPKADIRRTAQLVAAVDSLPAEVKSAIPVLTAFLIIGVIGTRTVQCGNGMCEDASAWVAEGGLGPQLLRFISGLLSSLPL
jgi:hypothetical protein